MNKDLHILINNEEVVCDKNITINEEMLSTSSTILKNCYPKSWETTKDYVSNFYFPKDYSKCKIFNEIYHPEIPGSTVSGSNLSINYDNTLNYEIEELKGNTTQNGTPTPSSPVPINNVTGLQNINVCGKNLYNLNLINSGLGINFELNGSELTLNGTTTGSGNIVNSIAYYFRLRAGTYTISSRILDGEYTPNGKDTAIYLRKKSNSNELFTIYSYINYEKTSTITLSEDTEVYMQIYTNGSGMVFNNLKIGLQIEKGSTATEYEEYKVQSYEINLGKNLYNASTSINGYINSSGGVNTGNDNLLSDYIKVESGKDYTVSLNTEFYNIGYALFNNSKVYVSRQNNNNKTTLTISIPSGIGYIRVWFTKKASYNLTPENILQFEPMIEKGSQATSYSEYFTPIELCKIGDYQDRIYSLNGKWYLEKKIGKVVLNGNEEWNSETAYAGYYRYILLTLGALNTNNGLNNRFIQRISQAHGGYEYLFIQTNNGAIHIQLLQSRLLSSSIADFKTWLSNNNVELYYVLATPTYTEITNTELINQLESIRLLKGINNISVISPNEFGLLQIHYNYKEAYTTEDLIFCGLVKNTGNISLNPREPHYVDLQLLDFKDLLSTGETLNYVITGKTIVEAIEQVVASISDYGFIVGNINILRPDDIINAYSTLNKTAYDVFQYISDITQSKWFTRVIDENTIAIDFYDPTLMPQATTIEYTKEYFENNDIEDMTFNYSTNDYRNKQIMTSDEVYANITQTETLVSNGYQDSYMAQNKIGIITSITVNGVSKTFATKSEVELGASADFEYQPGEMTFTSNTTYNAGSIIIITYYPIVRGREIVLNNEETSRIQSQINRKGTISRYENRNDTTSSQELIKIGQSYIKYKGKAEITLKIITSKNLFNVGQIVEFDAPLEDLSNKYMVKSKTIEIITTIDKIFYTYELSSNFNSENAINYFDNQRAKSQGNIGEGETIARAIDIESTALIKFYDTTINEVEVSNPTSLDFALDGVLI